MHPDATLIHQARNMVLNALSDSFYLTETRVRSRVGEKIPSQNIYDPGDNCAVLNISKTIKSVIPFSAEVEIKALFIN